jgi:hypothetical protein
MSAPFKKNLYAQAAGNEKVPNNQIYSTIYDLAHPSDGLRIMPILAIDSKNRNLAKYPNPNNYEVVFKSPYKDVVSLQLKFALIPNSSYVINKTNNKFYFQDSLEQVRNCTYYQVTLPVGDWPPENLEGPSIQHMLEEGMNNVTTTNSKYAVSYCRYTRKFTIQQIIGIGTFNLVFTTGLTKVGEHGTITVKKMGVDNFLSQEIPVGDFQNKYITHSIGPVIGFRAKNLTGKLEYTSDGTVNMNMDRYVILRIPGIERIDSNGDALNGAFAVISSSKVTCGDFRVEVDPLDDETYTKFFNPPIPSVGKMNIEFFNSLGEPFDFNGQDNLLIFAVDSLSQQVVYTGPAAV